ncbi:MAG TPA: hypothetical protein PK867_00435, partial [Pirellulales bacterium]|nr:hypothetical protein [Pirellulales bacterium]
MSRRKTAIALTLVALSAIGSAVAEGTIFGKSHRGRRSQAGSASHGGGGSMNTENTVLSADGTTRVSLKVQLER